MQKALLIILTLELFCCIAIPCQEEYQFPNCHISYAYDNAGNRVSRRVIVSKSNSEKASEEGKDTIKASDYFFEHIFGSRKIHVYPNPVQSILTVEIFNGETFDEYQIRLYDVGGRLLIEQSQSGNGVLSFDFSNFPHGIYILVLNTRDGNIEYKIIKE